MSSVASCMPVTMIPTNTETSTSAPMMMNDPKYAIATKPNASGF